MLFKRDISINNVYLGFVVIISNSCVYVGVVFIKSRIAELWLFYQCSLFIDKPYAAFFDNVIFIPYPDKQKMKVTSSL